MRHADSGSIRRRRLALRERAFAEPWHDPRHPRRWPPCRDARHACQFALRAFTRQSESALDASACARRGLYQVVPGAGASDPVSCGFRPGLWGGLCARWSGGTAVQRKQREVDRDAPRAQECDSVSPSQVMKHCPPVAASLSNGCSVCTNLFLCLCRGRWRLAHRTSTRAPHSNTPTPSPQNPCAAVTTRPAARASATACARPPAA